MTAAPKGQSKAAEENAIPEAASKPRAQRTKAEQAKIDKAIDSKPVNDHDAKAKVTTGSPKEGEVLPKAEPEAVSKPGDEQKTTDRTEVEENGPAVFTVAPAIPGPNDPVAEGQVQVTHRAEEGEPSDPSGNKTEARKTSKRAAPKKDPLVEIPDRAKLPVAVTVGQVVASVEEYVGRPVLSLSLVGWVGDAPLKILAADVGELEQALAEIRKELG